eukprot:m.25040 g.25040  ORF g.25040 m.25040 type:complete len:189 (-) comp7668_c0_seq3:75-641(-)
MATQSNENDHNADVEFPPHVVPVDTPQTWNFLEKVIAEKNVTILGRSLQDQRAYHKFKLRLDQKYADITSYIRESVFGWPLTQDSSGKLKIGDIPDGNSNAVYLRDNDFPYYLEDGVSHKVLWFETGDASTERIINFLDTRTVTGALADENNKSIQDEYDILWFVNPVAVQSVRGAPHAHVFLREKKN